MLSTSLPLHKQLVKPKASKLTPDTRLPSKVNFTSQESKGPLTSNTSNVNFSGLCKVYFANNISFKGLEGKKAQKGLPIPTEEDLISGNLFYRDLTKIDPEKLKTINFTTANLIGANLSGLDLTGMDLSGATLGMAKLINTNLSDTNLTGANFESATLIHADLTGANLTDTKFENATLTDANLAGANLTRTNFKYAKLWNANLSDTKVIKDSIKGSKPDFWFAELINAEIKGADLPEANFNKAILFKANITDSKFNAANFNRTCFIDAKLINCEFLNNTSFDNANFTKATVNSDFTGAYITDSNFTDANVVSNFTNAEMRYCDFINTQFVKTKFNDAHLNDSNFIRTSFSECALQQADFSDATFFERKDDKTNDWSNAVLANAKFYNKDDALKIVQNENDAKLKVENKLTKQENNNELKGFAKVSGMDSLKLQFQKRIINRIKYPDLYQKLGLSLPNGILLHGPSGCGKTFMAKALAEEVSKQVGHEIPFIEMTGVESKYIHETPKMIGDVFTKAKAEAQKHSLCVLLIDEIEKAIPSRANTSAEHQHLIEETNKYLTELQDIGKSGVIVLGATNLLERLDDAAIRPGRFDELIYVGPPDFDARKGLIKMSLEQRESGKKLAESFSKESTEYDELVKGLEGYSSSDVCKIVNDAAVEVAEETVKIMEAPGSNTNVEDVTIEIRHIEKAIKDFQKSRNKKVKPKETYNNGIYQ